MEENTRNPNSYEGGEDGEDRQSINTSSSAEQFVQGVLRNSGSMNGSSEQNMLVINPPAAETEPTRQQQSDGQHQPADISSADSHLRRNTPQITAADRQARKRKNDRAYRERIKEKQKQMKSTLDELQAENGLLKAENGLLNTEMESLKNENVWENQQFQTLSGELEALRNKFDDSHQKLIKQLENEQQLKFNLKTLEGENGRLKTEMESLKGENASVTQRFQTKSGELDALGNKFDHLLQKLNEKLDNERKFNLEKLEAENESLKIENALVNQKLETLSNELDKYKEKYENTHERKRELELDLKTLQAENGRLKDDIIEALKKDNVFVNQGIETQSKELRQLKRKLYKREVLEKELAPEKSCSCRQSTAGESTDFSRDLGQYPNVETEGCMQVVPDTD
ncbi:hypothetical protein SLE2022_059880 [Rubroshorea leprosula]